MILRDSGCQESFQKDLRSDEIIFLLIGIFFFFFLICDLHLE